MDERCFRHPKVEARTRCTHCSKPICSACVVATDAAVFCSPECAQARRNLGDQVHSRVKRIGEPGLIASLIRYAIIAAIILGILEFLGYVNFTPLF